MGRKKWRPLKVRDIRKVLKAHNFTKKSQEGSHEQWEGYVNGLRRMVTVPDYQEIGDKDLIKSIIDQSGLSRDLFYKD